MIDPILRELRLAQAHHCCEWEYADGKRCRNVRSLKVHHRTYKRYGKEKMNDLSVFCPCHHTLADFIKKMTLGVKVGEMRRWLVETLARSMRYMNSEDAMKVYGDKFIDEVCSWQASFDVWVKTKRTVVMRDVVRDTSLWLAWVSDTNEAMFRWHVSTLYRCVECAPIDNLFRMINNDAHA